jgi:HSP20 family molecular chaperone IbpA
MLDQLGATEGSVPSYPPYNIERNGENAFRISVAVAGFTDADLSIGTRENTLTIRGEKQTDAEEKSGDVLYKGIAERTPAPNQRRDEEKNTDDFFEGVRSPLQPTVLDGARDL